MKKAFNLAARDFLIWRLSDPTLRRYQALHEIAVPKRRFNIPYHLLINGAPSGPRKKKRKKV